MKAKIFLVILILMLTIFNFILFKNFYNEKINNNKVKESTYRIENNI